MKILNKTKYLTVLVLSAAFLLAGCHSTETSPDVDSGVFYNQAMCKYEVASDAEPEAGISEKIDQLIASDKKFEGYIDDACNRHSPLFTALDFDSFYEDFLSSSDNDGSGRVIRKRDLPGSFVLSGGQVLDSLEWIMVEWNENGVPSASMIKGIAGSDIVEIIFTPQDGWVNTGILVRKQFINALSLSNFDESVERWEFFFQDFLTPDKQSDLHDIVFSYCTTSTLEVRVPLTRNGDPISTIPNKSYELENDEIVTIKDIKLQMPDATNANVKVLFSIERISGETFNNAVFNCGL